MAQHTMANLSSTSTYIHLENVAVSVMMELTIRAEFHVDGNYARQIKALCILEGCLVRINN
ncbi:hypothetical protein KIN20_024628 [Parelaphostrongylus tenuis]|uniref:Uncharacterized protein n=1 Tax=Parelaphostrongylus tenuis TaxID=148309 RepID=A0AAD5N8C7_PARTN|nr:hypothetical protein KIN20_024628 [Parelaphostrongylus tenuis]